uniref:HNH endonuclease n=1 Tax=Rhizobium phage IG49 TaxID=3129228 RepID=A0AAU8HZC6_9CAUD
MIKIPKHSIVNKTSRILDRFGRNHEFPYCVYFTFYRGDKFENFYIGKTLVNNIHDKGYRGSSASKDFKSEIRENPHLFSIKIHKVFRTDKEAIDYENEIQTHFDVVKSPLFLNQAIYLNKDFAPKSKGRKESEETKAKKRASMLGKNVGKKREFTDEHRENIGKALRGKKRKPQSEELRKRRSEAALGKKRGPYKKKSD